MSTNEHVRQDLRYTDLYDWDTPEVNPDQITFQYAPSDGSDLSFSNFNNTLTTAFTLGANNVKAVYDAIKPSTQVENYGGKAPGID
jgi:hypothetical protein